MNNCTSCGGIFRGDPFAKTWTCEYCGQVNYNKEFLQRHIQTVNVERVSNLIQVAVVSYQSGEYSTSLEAFEKVLQEDSDNLDAWVYAALSAAQIMNLTNFDAIIPKVDNYLKQAEKLSSASDVYLVGRNVANELICNVLLRGAVMRLEEAKKVDFAYNSVDENYAKAKANEQIGVMISYIEAAMRLPINNPTIQCEIASVAIRGIKLYSGNNPYVVVLNKAKVIIADLKEKNPSLFQKYAYLLTDQQRSQSGCSSFFASAGDNKQPMIGKPVRALLVIVGSLLALLIIASLIVK
jgi:tetratricopeptide (TPR) repeat protein